MAINFSYELVGLGWCLCTIKTEQGACELSGSYLSNILFDFYSAVINLIQGSALESVIFPKEPGEYVWLITKVSEVDINIKITQHKKSPHFRSFDESGEIVFEQVVNLREFAKAFGTAMEDLISIWGLDGYKKKWYAHYFPLGKYEDLRELLKNL